MRPTFFGRARCWRTTRNLSSPYSCAIFRRINQPYKAARNRISGYSTATIGMSRTSRRPTSDAIQNGRLCCRNGPAEGRKCANFFRSSARAGGGRPAVSRRDAARVAFVRLGRAFPPALPTLARVRLQRLSPIGNSRNPPPRAENAANFFRSSARAVQKKTPPRRRASMIGSEACLRPTRCQDSGSTSLGHCV